VTTGASQFLATLARELTPAYITHVHPRAILLTGSAAKGLSDTYSDLDLILYHEDPPTAEQLAVVRDTLQPGNIRVNEDPGTRSTLEMYVYRDVECQLAHIPIATWERDMQEVLEQFQPATLTEKAIIGLLDGVALHGGDLIVQWQERAGNYPEELARATVTHYLRLTPIWLIPELWRTRDATIFFYQTLTEVSLNLLGVLAGLNRRYFSTFQFKRLHDFAGELPLAPDHLADRLDDAFTLDPVTASLAMERLAEETIALVEAHMPEVDTAAIRRTLGRRHQPWHIPARDI
jgi:hypothetical protein